MRVSHFRKVALLGSLVIFLFLGGHAVQAAGPTVVTNDVVAPATWTKLESPYIVKNAIVVKAVLTIEPGVVVKFDNNAANNFQAGISLQSDFTAVGTAGERIVFTSVCDDGHGGDTKSYSARCNTGPVNAEWAGIMFNNTTAHATIEYATILRASRGIAYQTNIQTLPYREVTVQHTEISQCSTGIFLRNTMPVLSFNVLKENTYGLEVATDISDRSPVIRDSSFLDNGVAAFVSYPGSTNIDARFNWWGDASGPYFQSADPALDNSGGLGNRVIQHWVQFRSWLMGEPDASVVCPTCASNVLFLPGLKASKLYKNDGTKDGDTLWLPTLFSNDLEELMLDENGRSKNAVYTKDTLATIPFGSLYSSFFQKLATLKHTGTINDYQSFAYDWRQNVEDIVSDGTPYPEGVLRKLAHDAEALVRTRSAKWPATRSTTAVSSPCALG